MQRLSETTKSKIVFSGKTIAAADWTVQLQDAPVFYLVLKALNKDKDAEDILNMMGAVLYDENNVQVWPVPDPNQAKGN